MLRQWANNAWQSSKSLYDKGFALLLGGLEATPTEEAVCGGWPRMTGTRRRGWRHWGLARVKVVDINSS